MIVTSFTAAAAYRIDEMIFLQPFIVKLHSLAEAATAVDLRLTYRCERFTELSKLRVDSRSDVELHFRNEFEGITPCAIHIIVCQFTCPDSRLSNDVALWWMT